MKKQIIILIGLVCFVSIANAQWQQTSLDTGQITCIAIRGNNIFAGTYGNGVYLSSNNGNSWTVVNTGLTNTIINTLAINDSNIFAGTDGGVFLSPINIINWTPVNTGLTNLHIRALMINDTNIFAGTFGGVFLSSNNGNNWSAINNGLTSLLVFSLAISDSDIFAGTSNGVYLSSNNGNSWTVANNGIPSGVLVTEFAVSGINIFAGTNQDGVFLTSNNGNNWTSVNNGTTNLIVYSLIISGDTLFAGTYATYSGCVLFSFNNGNSWIVANSGWPISNNWVQALAISGDTIFAGTNGLGVWKQSLSVLTGIKKIKTNKNTITVYPNPANDKLTIESLQKSTIEIINMQGQTILQRQLQLGETNIDISGLAKGIYILRVDNNEKIEVIRIVKE